MVQRATLIIHVRGRNYAEYNVVELDVQFRIIDHSASIESIVGSCTRSGSDIRGDERKTLVNGWTFGIVRELRLTRSSAEMTPALALPLSLESRFDVAFGGGTRYRIIPD